MASSDLPSASPRPWVFWTPAVRPSRDAHSGAVAGSTLFACLQAMGRASLLGINCRPTPLSAQKTEGEGEGSSHDRERQRDCNKVHAAMQGQSWGSQHRPRWVDTQGASREPARRAQGVDAMEQQQDERRAAGERAVGARERMNGLFAFCFPLPAVVGPSASVVGRNVGSPPLT